jgi:signal transduction histidine kinase/CheY-like chemotaxis protein
MAFGLLPRSFDGRNFIGFLLGGAVLAVAGSQNPHFRVMLTVLACMVLPQWYRAWLDLGSGPRAYPVIFMLFLGTCVNLCLAWFLRLFTLGGFKVQWEKIELARELEKARAEADAANEEKSRFLAQASHDLRQPIHAMGLFLASLNRDELAPQARSVFARLQQSVDVLSKLFGSLLDTTLLDTRQIVVTPSVFRLDELAHDICEEFRPAAAAEQAKLTADMPDQAVRSDPLIVRRILQNLVSNAIRHSGGGDVTVSASSRADGVWLEVRDTGHGIPDEEQARIFNAFERGAGSDPASGLGLGLAIVRRLCDLAGLRIELASARGTGAVFSVGPMQPADATDSGPRLEEPVLSDAGLRVLVVDDDGPTLEATAALLSGWGWDIDARQHVDRSDIAGLEKIDLVITDYELASGATALDLIGLVKAKHGPTPCIVISGSSTEETRKRVAEAGLLLLHKPVRPIELRSAVLGVLA